MSHSLSRYVTKCIKFMISHLSKRKLHLLGDYLFIMQWKQYMQILSFKKQKGNFQYYITLTCSYTEFLPLKITINMYLVKRTINNYQVLFALPAIIVSNTESHGHIFKYDITISSPKLTDSQRIMSFGDWPKKRWTLKPNL